MDKKLWNCIRFSGMVYLKHKKILLWDITWMNVRYSFEPWIIWSMHEKYKCLNYHIKPLWYWRIPKSYFYEKAHKMIMVQIDTFIDANSLYPQKYQ